MTQAEKLEALVRRAGGNGWLDVRPCLEQLAHTPDFGLVTFYPLVIFNHDFARALFGEENTHSQKPWSDDYSIHGACDGDCYGGAHFDGPVFEYRLMHAVISNNPIDYMYEAVFGE